MITFPPPHFLSYHTEKVDIVIQPDSSEFLEGNTVILTCVAYGRPGTPNITWSNDGYEIDPSDGVRIYQEVLEEGGIEFVVSMLEICGISEAEAGLYTCSATLQTGLTTISSPFWVNVTASARESLVMWSLVVVVALIQSVHPQL